MGAYKTRAQVFLPTSLQVGNNGTKVSKLIAGIGSACVPAMGASAVGTGSIAIPGTAAGDTVFVQLASIGASGVGIVAASSIANGASLTFFAFAGATTASAMAFNYIVVD